MQFFHVICNDIAMATTNQKLIKSDTIGKTLQGTSHCQNNKHVRDAKMAKSAIYRQLS